MACNKLVTCPYDEVHKVKESRLSLHITKCRLNHLDEEKFICPFNATHVVPHQEKNYHLSHCAERAPLDRALTQSMDRNNPFKGRTAVPSYTESAPTYTDEVWDDDDSEPAPGYVAVAPPACAIIEPRPMAKPAERRRLYQSLHKMPTEIERSNKSSDVPIKAPAVQMNRQPNALSQVENRRQEFQSQGFARGKPIPPSRIAANIFPSNPEPRVNFPNTINYSAALTAGMSNLSFGRGLTISTANNNLNDDDDDDEFPALGSGRGRGISYKSSSVRYPGSRT